MLGAATRPSSATAPGIGGLVPGLEPDPEDGETRPVGGLGASGAVSVQTNNGSGSATDAGTTTADASTARRLTIATSNVTGPTWGDFGSFTWDVGLTTAGRSGWIVQEIVNTYNSTDASGSPITDSGVIPHYWEAWAVDSSGAVSPSAGDINDMWRRAGRGSGSRGWWSMEGNCHFTTTDPADNGLTPGGVSNAGILLSGTTAPPGLGSTLLSRHANGSWDSTSRPPGPHAGTAGP